MLVITCLFWGISIVYGSVMFSTQLELADVTTNPNDNYRALRSLLINSPSVLPGSKRVILHIEESDWLTKGWSVVMEELSKLGVEIFVAENFGPTRDSFLYSLVEYSRFDRARSHVVHFSPLSYFMSRQLHMTLSSLMPNDDRILCSLYDESKDMPFANLMRKYGIDMSATSFDSNIKSIFQSDKIDGRSLFCSADLFVVPRVHLDRLVSRVRSLHSRMFLSSAARGLPSRIDSNDRKCYSSLVFNLALIEEGWVPVPLVPISGDVPSTHSLLLGRHPFGFAYISHVTHFDHHQLHFGPQEDGKGCMVHVPDGSVTEDMRTYLLQSLKHDGDLPCAIMAGSLGALPQASFVEIGGFDVFRQTTPGHTGTSVITLEQSREEEVMSLSSRTHSLLSLIAVGHIQDLSLREIFDHMKSLYSRISYIHLHGCLDSVGNLHKPNSNCSSSELSVSSQWDVGQELFTVLSPLAEAIPCVISIIPPLQSPAQISSFEEAMHKLGFIVMRESGMTVQIEEVRPVVGALGPHCSTGMFDWVRDLVQSETLVQAMPTYLSVQETQRRPMHANDIPASGADLSEEIEEVCAEDVSRTFPIPAGIALLQSSDPVVAVENILPSRLLSLLEGRLRHRSKVAMGANSHFIQFSRSGSSKAPPRSLVELIILKYLAPLAVGTQDEAMDRGFVGCEWWIQARETIDPKEYHMDTAITWCRDNGWADEFLKNCHFYPTLGSVNYITDAGGPTAVFDQYATKRGLKPSIPEGVGLAFPRRNRMLLFKGNRFHGVLRNSSHQTVGGSQRLTLLVNYWQNKTAGEIFTHEMEQEGLYMRHACQIMREEHHKTMASLGIPETATDCDSKDHSNDTKPLLPMIVPPTKVLMRHTNFLQDIVQWQHQVLPDRYTNELETLSPLPDALESEGGSEHPIGGSIPVPSSETVQAQFCIAMPTVARNVSSVDITNHQQTFNGATHSHNAFAGVYVFQLGRSELAESLQAHHESIVNHWTTWPQHESAPGGVQVVLAGSVENSVKWRQSLPGGYDEPE